jgi:Zn-dependent protease
MVWEPGQRDHEYREYLSSEQIELNYTHPEFYDRQGKGTEGRSSSLSYDGLPAAYTAPEAYAVDVGSEQQAVVREGTAGGRIRRGLAGIGGGLAALAAMVFKLQWLGLLLKFGWAGISALISIILYSMLFGWAFGIGIVALLFIHELGHALVIKLKGIPFKGMIFIPLLGAAVLMKKRPLNARDEAEIGIAGPLAGGLGAAGCLALAWLYHGQVWTPLAYFGFFLNLINLIPALPFDGGHVMAAIDRRLWLLGFSGLLAFQIWSWLNGDFSPWLLFFLAMVAISFWARRLSEMPDAQSYYRVRWPTRLLIALLYFGLVAALIGGISLSHALIFSSFSGQGALAPAGS